MGVGTIDPEYAVREGWARDSDDEIYMDGYNAFIQVTTRDGTSGFSVKNSIGDIAFSSKSDGDGYVAKRLGVGTFFPTVELEVIGKTKTDAFRMPTGASSDYVFTSDADGNAEWKPAGASTDVRVKVSASDTTAGYLEDKLIVGPGITLTKNNVGGNENLEVSITPGILDGYGAGTFPEPTCCGQILYAVDSSAFVMALPLVSKKSGWLMNNDGNFLVAG
jgi:hypothetical protein